MSMQGRKWRWPFRCRWPRRDHLQKCFDKWRGNYDFEGRFVPVAGTQASKDQVTNIMMKEMDEEKVQIKFPRNRTHTSKYTLLTFVPLNLFEQFRRAANFYFLCTLILTMILKDSPISPTSWLMSLLFVVAVTMAKQGYEDYLRHQSDREANETKVTVIREGKTSRIQSQYIRVGDVVQLTEGEQVPCDLIVMSTSHDHGQCFVMTANLDGETSLKTKFSNSLTKDLQTPEALSTFNGFVECEMPNPKLDNFLGRITSLPNFVRHLSNTSSLGQENILLSGTVLKNTDSVLGLCVYSGPDTKMSLNSKITLIKFSTIERSLNRFLLIFVLILLSELVMSTILSVTVGLECKNDDPWYLSSEEPDSSNRAKCIFKMFLLWLVLYNYIIPISMFVSIEIQRFISSKFIPWDKQLKDHDRGIKAKCNTSDINEELGLVTHLFTDKTGTLTRNIMIFQKYSHRGAIYDKSKLSSEDWCPLLMVMTLCHSVQVADDHFVASSPDEKALLEVCDQSGFQFQGSSLTGEMSVLMRRGNKELKFQKLVELEFDSFRKCMSVIVQDNESNRIFLLSKGAESSMLPVCVMGPIDQISRVVDDFADEGLRTLVLAYKELTLEEYSTFKDDLDHAKQAMTDRAKLVRDVYKGIEVGMEVLGATGIEDLLQEQVVETVAMLKKAGIIPWMLTGDKKETAMNLAHSAGLLESHCKLIDMCDVAERDAELIVNQVHSEMNVKYYSQSASLIVDGKSLLSIMKSDELKELFCDICNQCPTVIACRLSPIQKSQLVRMIKEEDSKNLTAAIGDGGNDISMIQEAHVGLGLIGQEGTAASKASDFAFTKFCHLQRVLLVHGHWYYRRLAFLVQYSFYKNVACFTCQLFYAIDSDWSGQTLYESMFLFLFNTIYSLLPVLVYGLMEQDKSDVDLLLNPRLYKDHRHNVLMKWSQLLKWLALGVWHALVCYYGAFFLWPSFTGLNDDLNCFGALVAFTSVIVINVKVLVESRYWTWPLVISVLISIVAYPVMTLLYEQFLASFWFFENFDQFRTIHQVLDELNTWLGLLLLTVIALIPDLVLKVTKPWQKSRFKGKKWGKNKFKVTPFVT